MDPNETWEDIYGSKNTRMVDSTGREIYRDPNGEEFTLDSSGNKYEVQKKKQKKSKPRMSGYSEFMIPEKVTSISTVLIKIFFALTFLMALDMFIFTLVIETHNIFIPTLIIFILLTISMPFIIKFNQNLNYTILDIAIIALRFINIISSGIIFLFIIQSFISTDLITETYKGSIIIVVSMILFSILQNIFLNKIIQYKKEAN